SATTSSPRACSEPLLPHRVRSARRRGGSRVARAEAAAQWSPGAEEDVLAGGQLRRAQPNVVGRLPAHEAGDRRGGGRWGEDRGRLSDRPVGEAVPERPTAAQDQVRHSFVIGYELDFFPERV